MFDSVAADADALTSALESMPYHAYSHRAHRPQWRTTSWWLVVGVMAGLQVLTLWHMHNQNTALAAQIAQLSSQQPSTPSTRASWRELTSSAPLAAGSSNPRGTTLDKPAKLLLGGLTPAADQGFRGDCWLFAIMGVLEDSYRRQGVARGWLAPDKYVRLSRQAFGIGVMDDCATRPSAMCPARANADGPIYWGNTTDGADERMLYFMKSLATHALPDAVCQYSVTSAGERICNGLGRARESNPLRFNVTAADMLFDVIDMQRALLERQHVLSLGMPVVWDEYYFPCTPATAKYYRCDPTEASTCVPCHRAHTAAPDVPASPFALFFSRWPRVRHRVLACVLQVPCPVERAFRNVDCCIAQRRPMFSMRGEWHHRKRGKLLAMGGHAVNVVGYTDTCARSRAVQGSHAQ